MYWQIEPCNYTHIIARFHIPSPEQSGVAVKLQQAAEMWFLANDLVRCIFINLPRLCPRSLFFLCWLGSPDYLTCLLAPGDITASPDLSPLLEIRN